MPVLNGCAREARDEAGGFDHCGCVGEWRRAAEHGLDKGIDGSEEGAPRWLHTRRFDCAAHPLASCIDQRHIKSAFLPVPSVQFLVLQSTRLRRCCQQWICRSGTLDGIAHGLIGVPPRQFLHPIETRAHVLATTLQDRWRDKRRRLQHATPELVVSPSSRCQCRCGRQLVDCHLKQWEPRCCRAWSIELFDLSEFLELLYFLCCCHQCLVYNCICTLRRSC
mmetsp:Transcript_4494/g.11865  ORF Transcript_4494/g.11865 Transcript_4494/m.11865 type:complete len:222 (-) Transcript_4494:191-856(-)